MVRKQRPWRAGLAAIATGTVLLAASEARGIYLDDEQNITLRARIYSQAAIRVQGSQPDTVPRTQAGQLVQHRNFFNPELDAKLTPYLNWFNASWFADDLRFRIAGWGFYDGIYDYGSSQFNEQRELFNSTFNTTVPCVNRAPNGTCLDTKTHGWFVRGPKIKLVNGATNFNQVFPDFEESDPRTVYGNQARVNELYLSYTKGPFFLRIGRQSISWGESDTIALLDQSNPFDLTLAAPGFFEDIDESRIPLYTLRTSYNLFDVLGPLSSGFIEGYWVPGVIDTTTAITPLLTVSPYSPRGTDPQSTAGQPGGVFPPQFQFLLIDHIPEQKWGNDRWGVRFQTVVNRFLTLQAWVYRTFPQQPVPVKVGPCDPRAAGHACPNYPTFNINGSNFFIISLEHNPVMVYGLAGTFFLEWLDGIVRLNAQLFEHEQGFIPERNLNVCPKDRDPKNARPCPEIAPGVRRNPISSPGSIPYADILRYEVGFDRFFFFRALNPTNSFILSASAVGSYNASETGNSKNDFRFGGQLKPGLVKVGNRLQLRGSVQDDFVNANALDAQFQQTFQTDYLHGRLNPRLTFIEFVRGTFAFHPSVIYRWNDWLLFQADYQLITGAYQSIGFFRDRDQVSFRVTYQLN